MKPLAGASGLAPLGFHLALAPAALGLLSGLTYGLLAVGLVLIYRANRIINFAYGQMGAIAVAVMGLLTHNLGFPYYLALIPALATGAAVGGTTELVVVRRLRNAPRLMSIVATLGVGSLLGQLASVVNPGAYSGSYLPNPPGLPAITLGGLRIDQAYMAMLVFTPVAVVALTVFLRRSRVGLGIRLSAANPDAARMAGISVTRMSSIVWSLAGTLSALTAVLIIPASGFSTASSFGPTLLLRALTAAVIAGLYSLPVACVAGLAIGIVEQLLLYNYPNSGGIPDVVFYVLILVALIQRAPRGRDSEKGSWVSVTTWKPLSAAVARLPENRLLRWSGTIIGLVVAVALPLAVSDTTATTLSAILAFSIVGLSVGIGAGLGGQLSLGQFGVAAIGAVAAYQASHVAPFPVVLAAGALAGAVTSLIIGAPALRLKGILLTVTTLGFALVTGEWLLNQGWALSAAGVTPPHPFLFGRSLDTGRSYYYIALTVFLIALAVAWNTRRLSLGRALLAIRDNEENARAFTVRVQRVKIQGFVLAGALAGLGGAVYLFLFNYADATTFPAQSSIDVVAMTVIGGLGILLGPLLGAFYIVGLPQFLPLGATAVAATQVGWLILVLYLPGGIGQALEQLRDRYVHWAASRHNLDVNAEPPRRADSPGADSPGSPSAGLPSAGLTAITRPRESSREAAAVLLEARSLRKSFGGVAAVQDVSLAVRRGEIVGLIGPNGAGKTTTFELLSGFTRPDGGQVFFDGSDVTRLGPERRGRLGLIRSFQDAALFPTMTVTETVRLAFEPGLPTSFGRSVLGLPGTEKERRRKASELIDVMGLGPYRSRRIQELSTGTRRITELACMIALSPSMLLLDEPSSGVAQRETEALAVLLRQLKAQLDLTMLIIEHDIPMIMGLADRVVAMNVGTVLAEGTPTAVQADPLVIEAYLGTNVAVINRCDATPSTSRLLVKEEGNR